MSVTTGPGPFRIEFLAEHPVFTEIAGRAAVTVPDTCYVLVDDEVFCVRHLDDGSDEILTYRAKRRVQPALIPSTVVLGSERPNLN